MISAIRQLMSDLRRRIGWVGCLIILTCCPLVHAGSPATTGGRSVTVTGTGEVKAKPDQATLQAAVVTRGKTAQTAFADNSQRMRQVLEGLARFGIPEVNVKTTQLNIAAQYERNRQRPSETEMPQLLGYQVTHSVVVRLTDIDRLGELLDKVVELGANQVNQVRFAIGDPEALLDNARVAAVQDARRKADLLSRTAGTTLGRVISIRDRPGQRREPVYAARMSMADSASVAVGQETLAVTVEVVFALDD